MFRGGELGAYKIKPVLRFRFAGGNKNITKNKGENQNYNFNTTFLMSNMKYITVHTKHCTCHCLSNA